MKVTVFGLHKTLSDLERLDPSAALSKALNATTKEYRKHLVTKIKSTYTTKLSHTYIDRLIYSKPSTKATMQSELKIIQVKHRLAMFQTSQVAITVGNNRKAVKSRRKGFRFKQKLTSKRATRTLVKVIKGRPYKLVTGSSINLPFKGFLQDSYGHIFIRKQQQTWIGGKRAPIRALFGLSVAQMARSYRVQQKMKAYKMEDKLEASVWKYVGKL